jgi:hypothetical protein
MNPRVLCPECSLLDIVQNYVIIPCQIRDIIDIVSSIQLAIDVRLELEQWRRDKLLVN